MHFIIHLTHVQHFYVYEYHGHHNEEKKNTLTRCTVFYAQLSFHLQTVITKRNVVALMQIIN